MHEKGRPFSVSCVQTLFLVIAVVVLAVVVVDACTLLLFSGPHSPANVFFEISERLFTWSI